MNPEALRSVINLERDLPEGMNPIDILIKDERRFFHSLGQHFMIADPNLKGEDTIRTIALAAGDIVNQRMLYHFFLDYMPDERARTLLEDLLGKMNTLTDSTFGRSMEEMQPLAQQRDKYRQVIDDVLMAYSTLTTYLKPKTTE